MRNLHRYLLPSALILAFGIAFGWAQSANQALQVSQDPTGTVGYDNVQGGIYLPGHLLSTTRKSPAPSVTGATCGTTTPTVTGTDFSGIITVGTSATTSCVLTFGTAFGTAPACVVSPRAALAALSATTTTTTMTITQTSTASNLISYVCVSTS